MLTGMMLDMADRVGRETAAFRSSIKSAPRVRTFDQNSPFGGLQVILVGDFAQLPPVADRNESEPPTYCFSAVSFKQADFKTVLLKTVFRTSEQDFVELLHRARFGALTEDDWTVLERRVDTSPPEHVPRLYPCNKGVDQYNQTRLNQLGSPIVAFGRRVIPDTKEAAELALKYGYEEVIQLAQG